MTVEVCYTINPWIMLTLGPRSADGSLCTAVAKTIILPLWGPRGIDQLESYDFGAERKRLKSPDRCLFNRAIASYEWLPSVAFVERHRGQVPLNFDEGGFNVRRFATRALACGERVRYPTIFPKSLDKIPDDRGWNRGKPGVNSVTLQRGSARV